MAEPTLEGSQPVDLSKHPSGIVPTLQNIVSTVNLDCKLDLKAIALQARNAEYNPKRFAAVIMRIREPKTTALIFASGKMVCTGAKSEQQSKLAARKYARIIQKLGFPAKFKDFKIQNIVGSCDVKFPIRLEGLAYSHGAFSSYEPELFPGLIYRMKQPKIVLLIFVSGKIVLTGAKVREETYTAFENIYPVLTEFRKVQQWYVASEYILTGMDNLLEASRTGVLNGKCYCWLLAPTSKCTYNLDLGGAYTLRSLPISPMRPGAVHLSMSTWIMLGRVDSWSWAAIVACNALVEVNNDRCSASAIVHFPFWKSFGSWSDWMYPTLSHSAMLT
ncbi:unnamed protein product [Miscanthus lutarioriparius]|uniref:Uncharacterized protein n=1 Tax=Miscanthus lutarioriparius TaxID=422564 RepID=A0A811RA11_9POAL|nr:unnamed protein product [Miscanthus lutarioriparius]